MVDWRSLLLSQQWLDRLDKLAARRFGPGGLAEEASAYVIERLSEDNWAAMSSYKGQAKPETFLHTLSANMLEEFSRERFGRPRPPEWLKRMGEPWVMLWKAICLERQDAEQVVARTCSNGMQEPKEIRHTIRTIKAKIPNCGLGNREISANSLRSSDDDDIKVEDLIADARTPAHHLANNAYDDVVLMLTHLFGGEANDTIEGLGEDFDKKFKSMREHLRLTEQEILLLRMVYRDGHKRNDIAATLGMAPHQPGRIIAGALNNIRLALERSGIDIGVLHEAMN